MPGDVHDRLIARAAFGQVRDERVPIVVPAALDAGFLAKIVPGGLERRYRARWIIRARLTVWEHIPFGPELAEPESIPFGVRCEGIVENGVQRNRAPFSASVLLRPTNR